MTRLCMIGLASCIGVTVAAGGEGEKTALPVTATLVAKEKTYKLDLGGMTPEAYKKSIEDAVQAGKAPPPPPTVDLVLELKNTSDKEVQVWVGGTQLQIDLDLKGPGALAVKPRVFFPSIVIPPKAIALAPGKTHAIPIKALRYGRRGGSDYAYWTKPGEYTLSASYKTGIAPAPKGSKEARGGFGLVTLKTAPIKLKVETPPAAKTSARPAVEARVSSASRRVIEYRSFVRLKN